MSAMKDSDKTPSTSRRERQTRSNRERVQIESAMAHLLSTPRADSVRWPSVSELARTAGIKRWVLTHKHVDLKDRFQAEIERLRTNPASPAAPQRPSSLQPLHEDIARLRRENAELRELVAAYEHALLAVGMEYHVLATQDSGAAKILPLPLQLPNSNRSHHRPPGAGGVS